MLIKDIPFRRIKKLAKKRVDTNWYYYKLSGDVYDSFPWGPSPELFAFWHMINTGRFETAYALRPDLFRPTKREVNEAYEMNTEFDKKD